jgi:endonuclease/exonuclease/phosphatase (EEP) superfamily protein YafD
VLAATWAYAALILTILGLIHLVGEAWWAVVALLFVPRWLYMIPIPFLILASGLVRQPSHWAMQGATALVIAGPLMGLSLPLAQLVTPPSQGTKFRILCYNRGERPLDCDRLIALIEREHVDLICFQEGSAGDAALEAYLSRGWHRDQTGYIASREPIVAELPPLPDDTTTEERMSARLTRVRIRTRSGLGFILASVHMPTMRRGFDRFFEGALPGLRLHIDWWASELDRVAKGLSELGDTPFLVGGDFNMPPDDSGLASLRTVLRFGFEEAGWGYGYTRPTKYPWFRIDHILASPDWEFTRCWVGPDFGSDHLPLLAEVVLPDPPPQPSTAPAKRRSGSRRISSQ